MELVDLALSVVAGLTATIPLVIKLIEYVKKSIREKNWPGLLEMVMGYMEVAEGKFKTGAEKKEWVLAMVKASADTINCDIDMNVVSDMIDDLCDMSNIINPPAEKAGE